MNLHACAVVELDNAEDDFYQPTRPLRHFVAGGTCQLTTRTQHGRFLMKPTREATELIAGVLAYALRLFPGVRMHGYWFLSNHYTMVATFQDELTMSGFMSFVNGNLAKELGRLFNWRERFWSRRYRAIEIVDKPALVPALAYLLAQGTKEGLVARPSDWPGLNCLATLLEGKEIVGVWFNRTKEYRARVQNKRYAKYDFTERIPIQLAPLPCWLELSEDGRRHLTAEIVEDIERKAAEARRESGRRPMGVRRILAVHPHDHPEEPAKSPAPLFLASDSVTRGLAVAAYREFVGKFRTAALKLHDGSLTTPWEFPAGCFPPRLAFRSARPQFVAA